MGLLEAVQVNLEVNSQYRTYIAQQLQAAQIDMARNVGVNDGVDRQAAVQHWTLALRQNQVPLERLTAMHDRATAMLRRITSVPDALREKVIGEA